MVIRGGVTFRADTSEMDGAVLQFLKALDKTIAVDLLERIGQKITLALRTQMRDNYNAPQRKYSGSSIKATGETGAAIEAENWTIGIEDHNLRVSWIPTNQDFLKLNASTSNKLQAIDFGTPRPMKQHSGYAKKVAFGYGALERPSPQEFAEKHKTTGSMDFFEGDGELRTNIKAWVEAKHLDIPYLAVVGAIMGTNDEGGAEIETEGGTKPADPPFLFGSTAPAIFERNYDTTKVELNIHGRALVDRAIRQAIEEGDYPKLKPTKGKRGKSPTESELISMGGEIIRSHRVDADGQPYTLYQAVVRGQIGNRGQFRSVVGHADSRNV